MGKQAPPRMPHRIQVPSWSTQETSGGTQAPPQRKQAALQSTQCTRWNIPISVQGTQAPPGKRRHQSGAPKQLIAAPDCLPGHTSISLECSIFMKQAPALDYPSTSGGTQAPLWAPTHIPRKTNHLLMHSDTPPRGA